MHTLDDLGERALGELASRMKMSFVRADDETVEMRMPVEGNRQGTLLLHGGANGVLVEHAGSILAMLNTPKDRLPVGTELSVSQLRSMTEGYVTAKATILHKGRSSMCVQVDVRDDSGELTAAGRLSVVFVCA
jgi:uncharacterized domain 1